MSRWLLLAGIILSELALGDVKVWHRKPGDYVDGSQPGRLDEQTVKLNSMRKHVRRLFDAQYKKSHRYRGVWLRQVLDSYPPKVGEDLVILHFSNEMVIPIPRTEVEGTTKLRLFLALGIFLNNTWTNGFPSISKEHMRFRDPRPIKFESNKIVSNTSWHPFLEDRNVKAFSPWAHADSLVGLEYANQAAYERQFSFPGNARVKAGQEVFLSRCQYCHGVRSVGSNFGWDFVDPLPIYKKRRQQDLLYHVKYEKALALERGLMMPNQSGFTEREARSLWAWLKAAATKRQGVYKP